MQKDSCVKGGGNRRRTFHVLKEVVIEEEHYINEHVIVVCFIENRPNQIAFAS